jgi:hypothetical protein
MYFLFIQIFSFVFFTVLTLDERPGATKVSAKGKTAVKQNKKERKPAISKVKKVSK